ncbi:MAG: DUF4185 domain-containing protein [Gammaproteobacteria bacterium]|nr:DUF4185 domain-containing protein [Gammaproteobacteria bacterium]
MDPLAITLSCWWSQQMPPEPVYPPSPVVAAIHFDIGSVRSEAPGSDNWAITWADDGTQYATWGDGGGFGGTNTRGRVSLGVARIRGGPRDYTGENLWGGSTAAHPATFEGKSYGLLAVNSALYLWRTGAASDDSAFAIQELYRSLDDGASWQPTGVRFARDDFPNRRGFFALTFLQFGKNNSAARDGFVYAYAPENQDNDWNVQVPGQIALLRAPVTGLTNRGAWQFFAGLDTHGKPAWASQPEKREPVFADPENGVMRTSVSYNPGLGRYFLITQQVSRYLLRNGHMGIYDAPEPWGPWSTVQLANPWCLGLQKGWKSVYWNFSPAWLSSDGTRFVLVYTGDDNWSTVEGEFRLGNRD